MDSAKKFTTGIHLEPQSADPSNPVEGDLQVADGVARDAGLWRYTGSAWSKDDSAITTKTGTYTVTTTDDIILVDATSGAFTITLPTAASTTAKKYHIVKIDSTANAVTIDGNGSETIDGATTQILDGQYTSMIISSNGSNWFSLSRTTILTAFIIDSKTTGTNAGTFTSGAWRTRDLNALSGDTEFISLSSNAFTLSPGTYDIEWSAPAYSSDATSIGAHTSKFTNTSDSADLIFGSAVRVRQDGGSTESTTNSLGAGRIVITASKTFEILHRCAATSTGTEGMGRAGGFGVDEIYTIVKVTKVG